ncbi:MAG: hypothetical protein AAGA71_13115 [Pseudomonadota bacterium]
MLWQDVVDIALKWPEVAEGTSYGEPSLKVRKRLLTRTRTEDDSIVFLDVPSEEREMLIAASPQTFFVEDHSKTTTSCWRTCKGSLHRKLKLCWKESGETLRPREQSPSSIRACGRSRCPGADIGPVFQTAASSA